MTNMFFIFEYLECTFGFLFPYQVEFEDIKGVIRIRKSKNDRQHNDQKK